ncbi:MAG: hypothetical protein ACREOI_19995 [bacterium]
MTPGTLLCDTNFKFSNGTFGKKILVVLKDGSSYPYIVIKVTSQQKNRGTKYGCQLTDRLPNFFLPQGCCYLKEHTWVQLEDFRKFDMTEFLNAHFSGQIVKLAELPWKITLELLECAIQSDDISVAQQKVLQETLTLLKKQKA